MKCLCCRKKGYQKNDCPLWKQHLKHGNKNFQPKVGVNVVIVEQCIPIIPPFVATQSQQLKEHEEAKIMSENSPTKGRRMKWDREKAKLVSEIQ
jgi:hypothetical protein